MLTTTVFSVLLKLAGANDCNILGFFGFTSSTAGSVLAWDVSEPNWCCQSAAGVVCEGDRIVALILDDKQIAGHFDSSFANLSGLMNLSAHFNMLNNSFQASEMFLPSSLTYLDLTANFLSGSVPTWLVQFPNLTRLALENNSLTGTLPHAVTSPLEWLDLGYNSLHGSLSPLQNLSNLQLLQLYANDFTGPLDPLMSLTNMQELDLSGNMLTGTLEPIQNMLRLNTLVAPFNSFTGNLSILQKFVHLQELFLGQNDFSGSLEPLSQLSQLQTLNLGNNQLTGSLLPIANLTRLVGLELDNNSFSGSLAPLRSLVQLKFLVLLENNFTGTLECVENLVNLHWLVVGENNLNGTLAPLARLNNLTWLAIQHNNFSGGLEPIYSCNALVHVNVSSNSLSGNVDLRSLTHLEQFRGSFNQFEDFLMLSSSIKYFDASYNYLSQFISVGPLFSLEVFNVSFNSFQDTLGSLELSTEHPTLADIRYNPFICPYPERPPLVVVALSPCVYNWATLEILLIAVAACVALGLCFLAWRACCYSKDSLAQASVVFVVMWLVRVVSAVTTAMSLWQMLVYMPAEVRDQDRACMDVNNRLVFDLVFTEIIAPPLPGNSLKEYVDSFHRESELPQSSLDINLSEFEMLCNSFPRCGYLHAPLYVCASVFPALHPGFTLLVIGSSILFCVVEILKLLPLLGCLYFGEAALKGRRAHLCSRSLFSPVLLLVGKAQWFVTYVVTWESHPCDHVLEFGYVGLPGGVFLSLMVYYHLYVLQTDWTVALYLSIVSNARTVLTTLFRMRSLLFSRKGKITQDLHVRQSLLETLHSSVNEY